jgi:hypothetical protein
MKNKYILNLKINFTKNHINFKKKIKKYDNYFYRFKSIELNILEKYLFYLQN